MVKIKRAYEDAEPGDGVRYLVDRLWPRGVAKTQLKLTGWSKDVAPSQALRKWFNHDPHKWDEFRRRYFAELDKNPQAWKPLLDAAHEGSITLVYGAQDTAHNNAVALYEYLAKHGAKNPATGHGKH